MDSCVEEPNNFGNVSLASSFETNKEISMLGWAITFLVVALIAAVLGFGGVAAVSVELAQIVFWVFLVLFALSLVYSLVTGRRPPAP